MKGGGGKTAAYLIAEAGVNHNGSLRLARRLIDVAASAGADAVKFQSFRSSDLAGRNAPKARYQIAATGASESQLQMLKRLELDESAHKTLVRHCRDRGIQFLSSPFDVGSVDLLARRLGLPLLKIASGEITNAPLLLAIARTGKPVILSTGMSTLGEIEAALGVLAFGYTRKGKAPSRESARRAFLSNAGRNVLREKVVLLHCTSEYPAPLADVHLRTMDVLRSAFGLPVGISDHTEGISVPIAAAAREAAVIEKHFTLDRGLPGPDHKASLEPGELKEMVRAVREVEQALGNPVKGPSEGEWGTRAVARKSLVAAKRIRAGDRFTVENLAVKRPGTGISPMRFWEYLGKRAMRNYEPDDLVDP
jgi:N-acetylneuraminate synthase